MSKEVPIFHEFEIYPGTTYPPEWEETLLNAARTAGLNLNDPENRKWLESVMRTGISSTTLNILRRLQEKDDQEEPI